LIGRIDTVVSIGVLKETKTAERRIALTPSDVVRLHEAGARVFIERTGGERAGFPDSGYRTAGAEILGSAADVIRASDVVIKVKEPALSEIEALRPEQLFMSFLHLAAYPELIPPLLRSRAVALGYETITVDGEHPVLRPMSEIAGALSLQVGEHYLEATSGGRGVLLPGIEGKEPGKVVIVGSGIVGEACGRLAYGQEMRVVFVDANPARLKTLGEEYPRAKLLPAVPERLASELEDADLLVGAVYVTGARAPKVVSRAQIARMPAGSVAVDVAIDQGGCFETSRPTTHEHPVYREAGVIHYCVTNIPAMVPHSASLALSAALMPYLLMIARQGLTAVRTEPPLRDAVNIEDGRVVLPALASVSTAA
jgi:alanine dehydrogenase